MFRINKTRKLIEQSIMLAISSLSDNIQESANERENAMDANSIRVLAEAYNLVHRGKNNRDF